MRVVIVAAVVLICWGRNAPLGAVELATLQISRDHIEASMSRSSVGSGAPESAGVTLNAALQPAEKVPTSASDLNLPKREIDSGAALSWTNLQAAMRDNPFVIEFTPQRWDSKQVAGFVVVLVSVFLLIFGFPAIVRSVVAVGRRKPLVFVGRANPSAGRCAEPNVDAGTYPELMTQIATEMMRASSAVNGLRGLSALQDALYRELDAVRSSLEFAPPARGSRDKSGDSRMPSRLMASLQETQRIIGIAEAARASFASAATPLEAITTRPEAYAFLGVNASASETVLKKAVDALRQCWHPDFATDEEDRRRRETRTKQINVAWDLISQKQISA